MVLLSHVGGYFILIENCAFYGTTLYRMQDKRKDVASLQATMPFY